MRIEYFYCLGGFKFLRRSSMYPSNNTAFLDVHEMSRKSNNSEGNVNWKTVGIYAVFLGVILSLVIVIILIFFVIYQSRSTGELKRKSTLFGTQQWSITQQQGDTKKIYGSMNTQKNHDKQEEQLTLHNENSTSL